MSGGTCVVKLRGVTSGQLIQLPAVQSASLNHQLNKIGEFSITLAMPAPKVVAESDEQYEVWVYEALEDSLVLLGKGSTQSASLSVADRPAQAFTCTDAAEALRLVDVPPIAPFEDVAFETIAETLINDFAPAGWSATFENSNNVNATFDVGQSASLFDALTQLASNTGNALRVNSAGLTVEMGMLGESAGLRAFQMPTNAGATDTPGQAWIKTVSMRRDYGDVLHKLGGFGGAYTDDAGVEQQVDLSLAVTAYPEYPIESATYGGVTYYWVRNTAVSSGVVRYKQSYTDIVPDEGATLEARTAASQALYEAIVAALKATAEPVVEYSLTLQGVSDSPSTYKVGAKLPIRYFGEGLYVGPDGRMEQIEYLTLNEDDLWITGITTAFSASGRVDTVTLSSAQQLVTTNLVDELAYQG